MCIFVFDSMSLVAYGDSDCESDEDNNLTPEVNNLPPSGIHEKTKTVGNKPFLSLPKPKVQTPDDYNSVEEAKVIVQTKKPVVNIQEKKDECPLFPTLPKPKAGGKVKILLPSLNEVQLFKLQFN